MNLSNGTKLLANNGRVIVIGSRGEVTINPRELMGRRASICAFTLWGITPEEEADIHAGLFAGLEDGALPHRRQGTATRRSGACAQGDPRARVGWQDCTRLLNVWRRIPLHGRELPHHYELVHDTRSYSAREDHAPLNDVSQRSRRRKSASLVTKCGRGPMQAARSTLS